jgi:hypothetical protein
MIDDLKLAISKMRGEARRAFQAMMSIKYCGGSARRAESLFGWNRESVEVGLHEQRTGIILSEKTPGSAGETPRV